MSKRARTEDAAEDDAKKNKEVYLFAMWSPVLKMFWAQGQMFAFQFTLLDQHSYLAREVLTGHECKATCMNGEFVIEETKELGLTKVKDKDVYHLRFLGAHNCVRDLLYMQTLTGEHVDNLTAWVEAANRWTELSTCTKNDKKALQEEFANWRTLLENVNEAYAEMLDEYCSE